MALIQGQVYRNHSLSIEGLKSGIHRVNSNTGTDSIWWWNQRNVQKPPLRMTIIVAETCSRHTMYITFICICFCFITIWKKSSMDGHELFKTGTDVLKQCQITLCKYFVSLAQWTDSACYENATRSVVDTVSKHYTASPDLLIPTVEKLCKISFREKSVFYTLCHNLVMKW
jgi:hypothetical protein